MTNYEQVKQWLDEGKIGEGQWDNFDILHTQHPDSILGVSLDEGVLVVELDQYGGPVTKRYEPGQTLGEVTVTADKPRRLSAGKIVLLSLGITLGVGAIAAIAIYTIKKLKK